MNCLGKQRKVFQVLAITLKIFELFHVSYIETCELMKIKSILSNSIRKVKKEVRIYIDIPKHLISTRITQ